MEPAKNAAGGMSGRECGGVGWANAGWCGEGGGRGLIRHGGTSKGTKGIISSIVSNNRFIILGFVSFVSAN